MSEQKPIEQIPANATTAYQKGFERHYSALLGMLRYFFTQLADESIEIAARAVMLAAPMPNAISMYTITQREQGFTPFQAFAFSLTLEIVVFLLVEIALLMWNGYLVKPRAYRWPFLLMVGVVLVATFIVVSMVYTLEPHKVMAWLPVISLCSFVAIGLKRWHERTESGAGKSAEDRLTELRGQYGNKVQALQSQLETLRANLESERLAKQSAEALANGFRNRVITLEKDLAVAETKVGLSTPANTGVSEPVSPNTRRAEVLRMLTQTESKADVNFAEWGRTFDTSDTTIRNDLKWLVKHGYWQNGSHWRALPKASQLLGEVVNAN